MNPDIHQQLTTTLRERLEIIGDHAFRDRDSQAHLARLQEVSERLVSLQATLPPDTDPHFLHYLQRCSYDKALAWLETR